jgi:poly-gamma-glutamate synthesis protein (capsule biosynthesis protein)
MADEEKIRKDIAAIKQRSDFVIVYLHAGVEYSRDITEQQVELFHTVADAGADVVLGSHPHVVQRSELYHTGGREVLINYSMGNFLSNQNDKYTDIGAMTKLRIRKQNGATTLADFEIMPTYRVRFRDTDGKTKRRIILASDIDGYNYISDKDRQYIREVRYEVTKLLNEDEDKYFNVKEAY